MEHICKSCKWHDDFTAVCFNGDSEYRADFTDDDESCPKWENNGNSRYMQTESEDIK